MLFASGDPTILILVVLLIIGLVELLIRFGGLTAERSRIVRSTHRIAVIAAIVVAVGFYLSLPAATFGDAIGASIIGALVAGCLWPIFYLGATVVVFVWTNVVREMWRLFAGFVVVVLLAPLRWAAAVFQSSHKGITHHESPPTPEVDRAQVAQDQAARENARLECQLYLDRHRMELDPHFTQERIDAYFTSYLNDSQPVERVQQRADHLLQRMRERVEIASPKVPFESLTEVSAHFESLRREIQEDPTYDDDAKESLTAAINLQEEDAIRQFLQR